MTWKLSLGAAALLTGIIFSIAGCGGSTETTTQSADASTTVAASTTVSTTSVLPAEGTLTDTIPPARTNSTTNNSSPDATPPQGQRPSMPEIDYAAAAAKLGVTEQQLKDAMGSDAQKPPDMSAAAATLGVTEEALRTALGFQAGGAPPNGTPPAGKQ
jgi:hypothetical protein